MRRGECHFSGLSHRLAERAERGKWKCNKQTVQLGAERCEIASK